MAIRFFDMFAGIGGFRSGLESVGGFSCIGYCEIDKYVRQAYEAMYDTEGEVYFNDARTIKPEELPDMDLICGGFPCQSFSIAGKRGGFADSRGTLFFEIARIAAVKRPSYLLLENVPGLLSHDQGRTFATIIGALSELGYDVAWQVLNSADFGVPQSRKRVYIVGYLRERCAGQILSFTEANAATVIQSIPGRQGDRVYDSGGLGVTLTSGAGGFGGKTGLYQVPLPIKSLTKTGYQLAYPGDSIDTAFSTINSRRGRVGEQMAHTLTTAPTQSVYFMDLNPTPKLTENARCITARQNRGVSKRIGESSGVFIEEGPKAVITPEREKIRQRGRRIKEPEEAMFTITAQDRHGVIHRGRVRKLMPIECWRLQGFTDEQFYKAQATGLSDGRLYKMAGNAVSVPVVAAVGRVIKDIDEQCKIM